MATKTTNTSTFRIASGVMAFCLLAAAGFVYLQSDSGGSGGTGSATGLAAASQALPSLAAAAVNGDEAALGRLRSAFQTVRSLRASASGVPGDAADWDALETSAGAILERADAISTINASVREVERSADTLVTAAEDLLGVSGATTELQAFQQTAAGLSAELAAFATATDRAAAAESLSGRVTYLREVGSALGGSASSLDIPALSPANREALLAPVQEELDAVDAAVATVVGFADQLDGLNADLDGLREAAASVYDASLGAGAVGPASGFFGGPILPIVLLVIALLLIPLLVWLHAKSGVFERTAREQAEQNERNQQAILRLLDELGSLADGDLTVEATVTEDITGAIADSINYAIEKLRELVATIDRTSIMVDSAAKQTESTATHMARAAENQAREISAATESIVSMAASIEEVSGNAERSSDVARHSVEVAHKGGEAVRRTIDGMNTIRETIQETSKRIKRLGESSQEIGNIVELINDIAEQTNILALNASIQASMAGEAGRGFAVVADEVQRLAERSTNATKQIEVLVRTIQADTNEAVVSMERSTTDVVGGALLAENAGAALDEIEQVSNQIANLVQNISGSARQQAGAAADVTRRTTKLKEIGEQTGKATTATAASISKLSLLASQLRETVAGFTLPSAALRASPIGTATAKIPVGKKPPAPAVKPIEEKAAGQG